MRLRLWVAKSLEATPSPRYNGFGRSLAFKENRCEAQVTLGLFLFSAIRNKPPKGTGKMPLKPKALGRKKNIVHVKGVKARVHVGTKDSANITVNVAIPAQKLIAALRRRNLI